MAASGWISLLFGFSPSPVEETLRTHDDGVAARQANRRHRRSNIAASLYAGGEHRPPYVTRYAGEQTGLADVSTDVDTPAIELYEVDAPDTAQDFTSIAKRINPPVYPFTSDAIPVNGDRRMTVREVNLWGQRSLDSQQQRFITDGAGVELPLPSSQPNSFSATTDAGGNLRVQAAYSFFPDDQRRLEAGTVFQVFATEAPGRPDPAVDTPGATVPVERVHRTGVAVLDTNVITGLSPDTVYNVLVVIQRPTVQSENVAVQVASTSTTVPAPPVLLGQRITLKIPEPS